jgi:hypothetical protein
MIDFEAGTVTVWDDAELGNKVVPIAELSLQPDGLIAAIKKGVQYRLDSINARRLALERGLTEPIRQQRLSSVPYRTRTVGEISLHRRLSHIWNKNECAGRQ